MEKEEKMKLDTLKTVCILTVCISICLLGSTGAFAKTVKIGALWPLSGPIAKDGTEHLRGAEIATEMINEAGGLWGGTKIELVPGDPVSPKAAMEEAERLISKEKVNIIMGTWSSSLSYTATAVAEKHKKFYWETAAFGNDIMERGYNYVFHVGGLASNFGELSAEYVKDEAPRTLNRKPEEIAVAAIYEDSLFGTTTSKFFVNKIRELGFKVVMMQSYSAKAVDLSSIILQLNEAKPDVVFQVSYFNDTVLFQRQAKELNFNTKIFVTAGSAGDPGMAKALGSSINYVHNVFRLCGEFYNDQYTVNLSKFKPEAIEALKEFFKRYAKKFGTTTGDVPPTALLGFNGAWTLYKFILPKAGSDDPEAVRKAALSLDLPLGTTPIGMGIKFAPPGDPRAGLNLNFVAGMFQWQNLKFYCVWPEDYRANKPAIPMPEWKDR